MKMGFSLCKIIANNFSNSLKSTNKCELDLLDYLSVIVQLEFDLD